MSKGFDSIIGNIFLGSDHQTFSMTLPPRLRDYYDKVVTPASGGNIRFTDAPSFMIDIIWSATRKLYKWPILCNISGTSGGGVGLGTGQLLAGQLGAASGSSRSHSRLTGGAIQHMVQAYATMNRFLARFLEHVTKIELWLISFCMESR